MVVVGWNVAAARVLILMKPTLMSTVENVAGSDDAEIGDVARDEVVTLQGVTLQGLDKWQETKRLF